MPRIAGINIPDHKQVATALTYIYGIGLSLSLRILRQAGINPYIKTSQVSAGQLNQLKGIIEKEYKVEGDLRRAERQSVKRLVDIGAWRGMRHSRGLPARGQTTRTNSRTVRGNVRKTMGSGRKPPPSPT